MFISILEDESTVRKFTPPVSIDTVDEHLHLEYSPGLSNEGWSRALALHESAFDRDGFSRCGTPGNELGEVRDTSGA